MGRVRGKTRMDNRVVETMPKPGVYYSGRSVKLTRLFDRIEKLDTLLFFIILS